MDSKRITNGNPEAAYFLTVWNKYLRRVDDAVDLPDMSSENLIACFALGAACYASNFYRRHTAQLQMPILICTNLWNIANDWERSPELWKRQQADVLRNADIFIANAVTQICSGWDAAGQCSRELLASAYVSHADKHGIPK
jgi:hypothetical protein